MKIQSLAIIFAIIVLPISIALSTTIGAQIDTINKQVYYDDILSNSTYDAVRAFQLNTVNNRYSSISDSKIRDIEASVASFYKSLAAGFGSTGYDEITLRSYIPSIVYTLYDGYYIYGQFKNTYDTNKVNKNLEGVDPTKTGTGTIKSPDYWASEDYFNADTNYQYGLKPYIYYTCRYKYGSNTDFVVNYTLDNYITIIGNVNGNYVTKSGYLIDPNKVEVLNESNGVVHQVRYDGNVIIEKETLNEYLLIANENEEIADTQRPENFTYITYNNRKIYKDNNSDRYFWYSNYKKMYINDYTTLEYAKARTVNGRLMSDSAGQYFKDAKEFSTWVNDNLGNITVEHIVYDDGTIGNNQGIVLPALLDENGISQNPEIIANTGSTPIFRANNNNNPMSEESAFNEHRMGVIRRSITINLITAIANFNRQTTSTYEFILPKIREEDWGKILNNISVITFMQGMPVGNYKLYNNYSVVTNDKNNEFVSQNQVFLEKISEENTGEHHSPGCTVLNKDDNYIGYSSIDYIRQNVKLSDESVYYFYPKTTTACYNCIVGTAANYDIDDIINGNRVYTENERGQSIVANDFSGNNGLRRATLSALARLRYDSYKTSNLSNSIQ